MREHDDVRAEYEFLKKSLYRKYANNRYEYTRDKNDFIKSILKQARNIVEEVSRNHLAHHGMFQSAKGMVSAMETLINQTQKSTGSIENLGNTILFLANNSLELFAKSYLAFIWSRDGVSLENMGTKFHDLLHKIKTIYDMQELSHICKMVGINKIDRILLRKS